MLNSSDYHGNDRSTSIQNDYGSVAINGIHDHVPLKVLRSKPLDRTTASVLIACVIFITTLNSLMNGIVMVAIPQMTQNLKIANNVLIW